MRALLRPAGGALLLALLLSPPPAEAKDLASVPISHASG
jgi:hypothetical protein